MIETIDTHNVRLPVTSGCDMRPSSVRRERAPHGAMSASDDG
jgi:hypothetical protein